jgi:hypothetical protein
MKSHRLFSLTNPVRCTTSSPFPSISSLSDCPGCSAANPSLCDSAFPRSGLLRTRMSCCHRVSTGACPQTFGGLTKTWKRKSKKRQSCRRVSTGACTPGGRSNKGGLRLNSRANEQPSMGWTLVKHPELSCQIYLRCDSKDCVL